MSNTETPVQQLPSTGKTEGSPVLPCQTKKCNLTVTVVRTDGDFVGVQLPISVTGPNPYNGNTGVYSSIEMWQIDPGTYTATVTLPTTGGPPLYILKPGQGDSTITLNPGDTGWIVIRIIPRPTPTIVIDDPKIVVVSYDYHGKPKPGVKRHRIPVKLGVIDPAGGEGRLTCNHVTGDPATDRVAVYTDETDGTKLDLPLTIPMNVLSAGKTVWVEGRNPSNAVNGTIFTLALANTDAPPRVVSVQATLTAIRLKLDIYKSRPENNGEPELFERGKRIDPGRCVLVQGTADKRLFAERARLAVAKAEPVDYAGKLFVKPLTDGIQFFAPDKEKPEAGQSALTEGDLKWPNGDIDSTNGKRFWLQGQTVSGAMGDTGVAVYLDVLPAWEGDRITMTVLKAELKLHKSRTVRDTDPDALGDDPKIETGRYVHVQDDRFQHGRGRITVCKVVPDGFDGTLVLSAWDITRSPYEGSKSGSPKVTLFNEEVPASGQSALALPYEIPHPTSFDTKGKVLWVQGKTVCTELIDTQLRLGVKEIDKGCDRVSFNVIRFKKLIADIPSTPPNTARKTITGGGDNGPVARHAFKHADPTPAGKDCCELFSVNEPLVLVEGSVKDSDPIKLTVEVEPAGKNIPVKWSVQRFSHKANAEGDPDAIINLANNSADPGLVADGSDVLKATLKLNAAGSFHVRPYVDCNDDSKYNHNDDEGKRIDREPFLLMNLQLIRVQGVSNLTSGNSTAGTNGTRKVAQDFGPPWGILNLPVQISTGNKPWANGQCAITMRNIARVIGGGANGKRGLNKLFSGWCNNMQNTATSPTGAGLDITSVYEDASSNSYTTACWFEVDGARIPAPILDAGAYGPPGTEGTGGNTATSTTLSNDCPVTKLDHSSGIGQTWEVTNLDAPGFGINPFHPTVSGANLVRFRFNIDFRCDFIFWTNAQGVSNNTNAPACRLYSTVSTNYWTVRFEATYNATFVETVVNGPTNSVVRDGNETRRATPVDGSGLETRLPDSLDTLETHQPI